MQNILNLTYLEAQAFFLKGESYSNIDFPHYFDFNSIIKEIFKETLNKTLVDCCNQIPKGKGKHKADVPSGFENVCYQLLTNKDGKYAWRPLQLIHPFLYCLLVKEVTKQNSWAIIQARFAQFSANKKIECLSIPAQSETKKSDKAENILNWWNGIEQKSIKLSLKYDHVLITDITDCYSAIYTHSIVWALHTVPVAKQKTGTLLGDKIDSLIREMRYGQTNGIPQGSVLMDFIAEIILGYVDEELSKKLNTHNINDYKILRYRDDYRVFSNNIFELEIIAKLLTETLVDLGLKLNSGKTYLSSDVIKSSLKSDKLYYISNTPIYARNKYFLFSTIQQELLFIHDVSSKHPNTGVISKLLTITYKKRIIKREIIKEDLNVLISIIVDIIYKNPRTYSVGFAIISKLLTMITDKEEVKSITNDIFEKFKKVPNTGLMQIWLQRITIPIKGKVEFTEPICRLVASEAIELWESNWLKPKLRAKLSILKFIDKNKLEKLSPVLDMSEISMFEYGEEISIDQ